MEKRFQIVTDSSCDLPQALADELDLAVLPLHVLIGEHTYANYLDGREIGFSQYRLGLYLIENQSADRPGACRSL